jgi:hypothetical protein
MIMIERMRTSSERVSLTDPNDVLVDNAHRLSLSRSQHHFGHNITSVTTSLQPRPQPVGHARQRNPNLLH